MEKYVGIDLGKMHQNKQCIKGRLIFLVALIYSIKHQVLYKIQLYSKSSYSFFEKKLYIFRKY